MWLPILVTVLAAGGNNVGKVLQKQATRTLPRLVLEPSVLAQYLSSTTWVLGMAVDLGGALLMVVAFALAPVSVVQPVSAVGLVILLIFSHFYLKERLRPREWAAAAVALLGVLGLGVSAEPGHLAHPDHLHPARILAGFLAMVGALAAECWWRQQQQQQQVAAALQPRLVAADAILCGLEGGACFGFSAAACRTGFILARRVSWIWAPLGLMASLLLTSSGFVLQTRGLKAGNTVVVCTMAAASSMVTGVLAGLLALGERMPSSHHLRVARLLSWVAILGGVSSLAGGTEGLVTVVRALAAALVSMQAPMPAWLWRALPRQLTTQLLKARKRLMVVAEADELPVAHQLGGTPGLRVVGSPGGKAAG